MVQPAGEPPMAGRHQLGIARQETGGDQLNTKSMTSKKLISQKPRLIKSSSASNTTNDSLSELVSAQNIAIDLAPASGDKSCDQAAIGKISSDKRLNDKCFDDSNFADGDFDANTSKQNIQICNSQGHNPPANLEPADVDDVYRQCRNLGMRLSRQRRMVLDLLWVEKSHLSARDIFERLNNLGRNIGHTSVYQNLEALQSAGVIECLDRANGRLYGYRSDPHSHLTCTKTGNIQDLDVELPAELLRQIEAHTGYAIESYTMQFTGHPM
jgi:Fur family ferric uptake transcriptional regulator